MTFDKKYVGVDEVGFIALNTLLPKYLNTLVFCKIPLEKGSIERFYVYIF